MAAAANGPGSHRTEREAATSRERQVGSGAERQRYRAAPIEPVLGLRRSECGTPPNEGGTAEGTAFRPEQTKVVSSILGCRGPRADEPTEGRTAMTDPLSLTEAKRLAGTADTILLRATRTPTSRRPSARSCASTTARRPPTCSSPSRAASAWAATASWGSGRAGCSRSATGRPHDDPPGQRRCLLAGPAGRRDRDAGSPRRAPRLRPEAPRPAHRGYATVHRRRGRRALVRRGRRIRAVRAATGQGPGGRAARRVHRDGPRAGVRPPDP